MESRYTHEEEDFRAQVREALAPFRRLKGFFPEAEDKDRHAVFAELARRNWLALTWPLEYGGEGKSLTYDYILWDEMAYARAGRSPTGAGIIARTIMRFATDAQKAHWLPLIRRDEIQLCLGYSESEAGSDLASLRTRAELRGDHYVINGEKIWTSHAEICDYVWLLCRTGAPDSRSRGLSLFIVDLKSPGVELRNGLHMDGHRYSQVFYTDVVVPVENRIGAENGAWQMIGAALADERHVKFPARRVLRDFEDAVAWLGKAGLLGDPVIRNRLRELSVRVMEVEALCLQVLSDMLHDKDASVSAAANKVTHTDVVQDIARFVMDVGGPAALVHGEPDDPEGMWRQTMIESIGGGTSEIMKGIIARNALGLTM